MGDLQGRSLLGAFLLLAAPFAFAGFALYEHDLAAVAPAAGLLLLTLSTPGTGPRRIAERLFFGLIVFDAGWSLPHVMEHGRGATIAYVAGLAVMALLFWWKYPEYRRQEEGRAAEIATRRETEE